MSDLEMVKKLQLCLERQPGNMHRFSLGNMLSEIFPGFLLMLRTDLSGLMLDRADGPERGRVNLRNAGILPVDEKRVLPRFPLEMPVWLRLPGSDATVHAKTRDVSASGVFFYVNCEIRPEAEIEFTMTLPPELTRTAAIQVSCKGKVVRVQNDPDTGKIGIAAAIHSYDFLAQAASNLGDA